MALLLNFAPVSLEGETRFFAGRSVYSEERLRGLRAEFFQTHVFRRDHENDDILDIPIAARAEPISDKQEEIDLDTDRYLLPMLVREALIRAFMGRRPMRRDRSTPICVIGSPKKNLITHSDLPDWVKRLTMQHFDVRTLFLPDGDPVTGIICDVRTTNLIDAPCMELLDMGIDITGKFVLTEDPPYDPRFMPWRSLAGRVIGRDGKELFLDQTHDCADAVDAANVFLEARYETFNWLVEQLLGDRAERVLADADQRASQLAKGPGRRSHLAQTLEFLQKADIEPIPGARIILGDLLTSTQKEFPPAKTFDKPIFVFDPSGSRKDHWTERGLQKNGPYDQRVFTPKALKIAVICQSQLEGQVDGFMAKFLEGMPNIMTGNGQYQRAPFGDGFIRRYKLEKPSVSYFTADTPSPESYADTVRRALEAANDGGFEWDLALVQVEESFKTLEGDANPYFVVTSMLLKRQIPVQNIKIETMLQRDQNLVFTLNNLSLAIYAKIKGVPWLLASSQTVARELVIGLGSHTHKSSRFGSGERYVGITSVFASDGTYLLSDKTEVVPFEDYADALYQTLARCIERVRKQDNWRSSDKVRLVFHVFKPLKDTEVEATRRTVEKLDIEDVSFAFVHIADDHPWLIFDLDQKGIGWSNPKKGILAPSRGLYLKLGDTQALVVLSGASELKLERHGMPRPALLRLHWDSSFKDLEYLARQAFEFAGHSWRVMSPESVPITIKYSNKIAERLTGLASVSGWDPEAIQVGKVGRSLWFL